MVMRVDDALRGIDDVFDHLVEPLLRQRIRQLRLLHRDRVQDSCMGIST